MHDATRALLALACTGLGIAFLVMLFQVFYHVHDELIAFGGAFGLALFFVLWLKIHIANRPIRVKPNMYTEPKVGRHRAEGATEIIIGKYYTWLRKKDDFDDLFTVMLTEKRAKPAPIF